MLAFKIISDSFKYVMAIVSGTFLIIKFSIPVLQGMTIWMTPSPRITDLGAAPGVKVH